MSENENKMCKPWQHPKNHDKKNYRKHKDRVKQNISYCLRFSPPKFCSGSTPQCHLSILNGGRGIKSGRGIVQNDFNNRIRSEITDIHLGGWEEILSELLSHFLWIFSFGRNSNCTHARHDAAGGIDVNWKNVSTGKARTNKFPLLCKYNLSVDRYFRIGYVSLLHVVWWIFYYVQRGQG